MHGLINEQCQLSHCDISSNSSIILSLLIWYWFIVGLLHLLKPAAHTDQETLQYLKVPRAPRKSEGNRAPSISEGDKKLKIFHIKMHFK